MIKATIIQDSYSDNTNSRITTFELEYPRFIHAEFLTHHSINKNSASSRAIPVKTMIDTIRETPAMPIHWGKNQSGMQASEENDSLVDIEEYSITKDRAWKVAMLQSIRVAEAFNKAGYHKQIVNRLTEPFQHMKVVATATDWQNFFWLRNHKDAQPEIHELARQMQELYNSHTPKVVCVGGWHVPYVYRSFEGKDVKYFLDEERTVKLKLDEALKVSASLCAQVSYRKSDYSLEKALDIYDRLVTNEPVHASPFEHQAFAYFNGNLREHPYDWDEGITHVDRHGEYYSGNLRGWIQHRQLIPNNVRKY